MNTGAFGEGFPYTNFHDMNLDWMIKIAKDFLDQYTHIQDVISQGLTDLGDKTDTGLELLQEKYEELDTLLDTWYETHSSDIANQLASALADLNAWYTEHQNYLDSYLTSSILAFNAAAEAKATATIATIPQDYSELSADVLNMTEAFKTEVTAPVSVNMTIAETGTTYISDTYLFAGEQYLLSLTSTDTESKRVLLYARHNANNTLALVNGQEGFLTPNVSGQLVAASPQATDYTGSFTVKVTPMTIRRAISSTFELLTTQAQVDMVTFGSGSANDLRKNTIYMLGAAPAVMTDLPEGFRPLGTIMTYSHIPSGSTGKAQIYMDTFGRTAHRYFYNSDYGWTEWHILNKDVKLTFDMSSGQQMGTSFFQLTAGQTYYIKTNVESSAADPRNFNVYVTDHADDFIRCYDFFREYTPSNSGGLRVANLTHWEGTLELTIIPKDAESEKMIKTPKEYYVDKTGVKSNVTSLTDMILSFTKNARNDNSSTGLDMDDLPKVIYVYEGTYDIFEEYIAEINKGNDSRLYSMSDFPDDISAQNCYGMYNAWLPPNTKLVGLGNVVLKFTPTTAQINIGASLTWAPLNVFGSCHVENITINCENGRYGIHDDPGSYKFEDSVHTYKNVKVYYKSTSADYGRHNAIGFGFAPRSTYNFINCELIYDGTNASGIFYGHDDGIESAVINLENTIIRSTNSNEKRAVRLQSIFSTTSDQGLIKVLISNCSLNDGIYYDYASSYTNAFQVNCLHSGNPVITYRSGIDPAGNVYPPAIYP